MQRTDVTTSFAVFGRQFGICGLAEEISYSNHVYYHYATTNVLGSLDPLHELTCVKHC